MTRGEWNVAAVALSAVLVFGVPLKAQVSDDTTGDAYDYVQIDDSLLANSVLQPEPDPEDDEPAAAPPRGQLFSRALLGSSGRSGRVRRVPNMYGDSKAFGINTAEADARFKIGENNNPLPAHRVFFNYDHFHNAFPISTTRDEHLDRFTFGFEKLFCDGWASFELRLRMLNGMDAVQPGLFPSVEGNEFGNIGLTLKRLLREDDCGATSIGLTVSLPTAPDTVFNAVGAAPVTVRNDAYLLQPFIGWLYTPTDTHFFQAFAQFEFDPNGNQVVGAPGGTRLHGQTLMFLDAKAGWWLYEDPCARLITGAAPFIELHYTHTLQDADTIGTLGNTLNHVDILNLTSGLHLLVGERSSVTAAVVVPLRDGAEHLFDTEFGIQVNCFF